MGITDKEAKRLGLSEFIPKRSGKARRKQGEMTYTEKRYERLLYGRKLAGEIEGWDYESDVLELGPDCFFNPDFKVWICKEDNLYEYHEVKGKGIAELAVDGIVKLKWAALQYSPVRFYLCSWQRSQWKIRLMKGRKQMSQDWYQDVLDFHKKLAPSRVAPLPTIPPDEMVDQRFGWINEEIDEFADSEDIAGRADAIGDAIYFFIGLALDHGIDLRPVWDAIHAANMAKEGGETRADGKLMKPPGWTPPDIAAVLAKQAPII